MFPDTDPRIYYWHTLDYDHNPYLLHILVDNQYTDRQNIPVNNYTIQHRFALCKLHSRHMAMDCKDYADFPWQELKYPNYNLHTLDNLFKAILLGGIRAQPVNGSPV